MFSVQGQEKIDEAQRPFIIEEAEKNGIGSVIGEENVQPLYRSIYSVVPQEILRPIVEAGVSDGGDIRKPFRDYLHNLAAQGAENDETGLLFAIYDEIRSETGNYALTDNDIRYMLWKDTADAKEGDILSIAEQQAMKHRWGVGEPILYSARGEFEEATTEAAENAAARVESAAAELEEVKKETKQEEDETSQLWGRANDIRKAMAAQKASDKATVDSIVKLAKEMLKNGKVVGAKTAAGVRTLLLPPAGKEARGAK